MQFGLKPGALILFTRTPSKYQPKWWLIVGLVEKTSFDIRKDEFVLENNRSIHKPATQLSVEAFQYPVEGSGKNRDPETLLVSPWHQPEEGILQKDMQLEHTAKLPACHTRPRAWRASISLLTFGPSSRMLAVLMAAWMQCAFCFIPVSVKCNTSRLEGISRFCSPLTCFGKDRNDWVLGSLFFKIKLQKKDRTFGRSRVFLEDAT